MRTNSPRLVNPALVHDRHFAGQIGIQTPATIGQRQGDLAAEKQQLTKAPAVGGTLVDNTAAKSLLTTLHEAGVITDQTEEGFTDVVPYHDVNAGSAIGTSETLDITQEVRRYNNNSGPDMVVTLPPLSTIPPGKIYTFHRDDESGFRVTITAALGDTIDNKATYELIGSNSCITIMSVSSTAWVITSRNSGDLRFFESVPSIGQNFTAGGITANTAYFSRVLLHEPMTVYRANYALGATGGAFNIDIGIYYSDGTTLRRLGSTGSLALGAINAVSPAIFPALFNLYPGFDYYIGLACTSSTPLFYKFIGTQLLTFVRNQVIGFPTSFPLPATLPIASGAITTNQPWVLVEGIHLTP